APAANCTLKRRRRRFLRPYRPQWVPGFHPGLSSAGPLGRGSAAGRLAAAGTAAGPKPRVEPWDPGPTPHRRPEGPRDRSVSYPLSRFPPPGTRAPLAFQDRADAAAEFAQLGIDHGGEVGEAFDRGQHVGPAAPVLARGPVALDLIED